MRTFKTYYPTAIGPLEIVGTHAGIVSVNFVEDQLPGDTELPPGIVGCANQIDEYFKGQRKEFVLDLILHGTEFQKTVWRELAKIPYGKIVSYGELAKLIGKPKAGRAVGSANGRNPISIILPCHRVIGSNGSLTGYGGGIWRKEWLLKHEGVQFGSKTKIKHVGKATAPG
jgi:methylated-DNA-[protein]-cysteine S-methyltransferase